MVGRSSERTLLTTERTSGKVIDWRGWFGWILPTEPVDHPQASRHAGKIYFAKEDIQEEIAEVGAAVSFLVYLDDNGIGALGVRPRKADGTEAKVVARGSGVHVPPRKLSGNADVPYLPPEEPQDSVKPVDAEEAWLRMLKTLQETVAAAVGLVHHMETEWTVEEMVENVVMHFNNAGQMPELLVVSWTEAVSQYIEHAIRGYAAAFCGKPWFFQLDLGEAIFLSLADLLAASCVSPRAGLQELEAAAAERYEELMDAMLLDKAIWEATASTFTDDEKVRSKVYCCLHASHGTALKEATEDPKLFPRLHRVEVFWRRWMEETIKRAWQELGDRGAEQLEDVNITLLFQNLVAPFGEEHPFSCFPFFLMEGMGRPQRDWPFFRQTALRIAEKAPKQHEGPQPKAASCAVNK